MYRCISSPTVIRFSFEDSPIGLYPLNIPSCAIWQQNGVTVAGNTSSSPGSDLRSLSSPVGLFIDQNNSLFIADRDNNRTVRYDGNDTTGVVVAGDTGPNLLNRPRSVAVDRYGFIIVADSLNHRVLNFSNRSHSTVVIQSSNNLTLGELFELHIDMNNSVYVIDPSNAHIIKVISNQTGEIILSTQNGSGSTATQFSGPISYFIDQNYTWYIADTNNHRIQMLPAQATNGTTVAGVSGTAGNSSAHLSKPHAVLVDDNGYEWL